MWGRGPALYKQNYMFVSYRRLSPQFQFSLSGVTLVYLSQWFCVLFLCTVLYHVAGVQEYIARGLCLFGCRLIWLQALFPVIIHTLADCTVYMLYREKKA